MGGTCKGNVNKILYAWAMDAPPLDLPKSESFWPSMELHA